MANGKQHASVHFDRPSSGCSAEGRRAKTSRAAWCWIGAPCVVRFVGVALEFEHQDYKVSKKQICVASFRDSDLGQLRHTKGLHFRSRGAEGAGIST